MDWLDTRTDQLGRIERYTYDLAGNVSQFQDRKNQVTTWAAYDARNRPTTVTYHDASTLTYNYDGGGRLWQLTDSLSGTITRTFDALDRLTRELTPQGVIDYTPDDADRRRSMLVAGQPPVSYAWDNANRLGTITRDTLVASYAYDAANRRTQLTLPNGVAIDYGYDAASRLTSLTYSGLQGGPQTLTYAYDPAGNRVRTGGSWARTLLPAAVSGGTYDAANRQLTLGGKTMTYDFNGNLATLTESGQTTNYTWDARDRLVGLSGPGLSASFTYDAKLRRTRKTINAFSTNFHYDGWDIVREVAGGTTVSYLRNLPTDETLARIEEGGNTLCYAPDALGSTVALTDGGGSVPTEYTYEPFGTTLPSGAANQNAFQFTGREADAPGLYHYRARYYHPRLPRFLGEDPIGFAGGDANLYGYVKRNPVNATDPLGLSPDPCHQVVDNWKKECDKTTRWAGAGWGFACGLVSGGPGAIPRQGHLGVPGVRVRYYKFPPPSPPGILIGIPAGAACTAVATIYVIAQNQYCEETHEKLKASCNDPMWEPDLAPTLMPPGADCQPMGP
jgi:RHS repeat-associated protein